MFQQGRPAHVAPFAVPEVDPTGAGDVFATALLLRLAEQATPAAAARFAAATAALSVQGPGIAAIPDRPTVEALLQGGSC
jgi:sugar/nucleoside kinase (ribokinase family)